jgi:uncharacterized coiled-coil protein SlyX
MKMPYETRIRELEQKLSFAEQKSMELEKEANESKRKNNINQVDQNDTIKRLSSDNNVLNKRNKDLEYENVQLIE